MVGPRVSTLVIRDACDEKPACISCRENAVYFTWHSTPPMLLPSRFSEAATSEWCGVSNPLSFMTMIASFELGSKQKRLEAQASDLVPVEQEDFVEESGGSAGALPWPLGGLRQLSVHVLRREHLAPLLRLPPCSAIGQREPPPRRPPRRPGTKRGGIL